MKPLDRLIIKAKKKCGVDRLEVGFISPSETEPGKWIARGDIWNGIFGSSIRSITCVCDSTETADTALQELSEKYPNNEDVVVFIEDVTE